MKHPDEAPPLPVCLALVLFHSIAVAEPARQTTARGAVRVAPRDSSMDRKGAAWLAVGQAAYTLAAREMPAPGAAVDFIRGSRQRWSQDEGLALFLVIDAMLPDWQSRAFDSAPASVVDLLGQAVERTAE